MKVSEIIRDMLLVLSAIDSNEDPTAREEEDALRGLNNLLNMWSADGYMIYGYTREEFTMTANKNEYTLGTGGDFNTDRPASIDSMQIKYPGGSIDYDVEIVPQNQYDARRLKTTLGRPYYCFVNPGYPLTKLLFTNTPDQAYTLRINFFDRITEFASRNSDVSLPEEYRMALVYNGAKYMGLQFVDSIPGDVRAMAKETKSVITAINASNLLGVSEVDASILSQGRRITRRELFND